MNSLYHALLVQHPRQLTSVRCAEQTIAQLHRYFEDVVLENNLAALVIESLPCLRERSLRELARVREIGRAAENTFIFVGVDDALNTLPLRINEHDREPVLLQDPGRGEFFERFIVVSDMRFSALLASVKYHNAEADHLGDEVIWTFEPDVVYTALEYLMARVTAERPLQAPRFVTAVRASMPKATSLQLTVAVTTKLARMLQEQAGREVAINRIATAIRNTLELEHLLQTTVNEVGHALGAICALQVSTEPGQPKLTTLWFPTETQADLMEESEVLADLDGYSARLREHMQSHVVDGRAAGPGGSYNVRPLAVVPLIFQARFMGVLMVNAQDPTRVWQESELLLLRTVADQVIVAVEHARLYKLSQKMAMTDALTGCRNRRDFEEQLDRQLRAAKRDPRVFSLVMFDVDHFKRINDTYGHDVGDIVLRMIGEKLGEGLRPDDYIARTGADSRLAEDTHTDSYAARFGGEEFVMILPQTGAEGAITVAERLREQLATMEIPNVGTITASFGYSTYPDHGETRDELVSAADKALYEAKRGGRNCVGHPPAVNPVNADSANVGNP